MNEQKKSRIYIIGAGFAGQAIAAEITEKGIFGKIIAFLDDDREKIGKNINSIPVFGPINQTEKIIEKNPLNEVLIAIPGASRNQLKRIYSILKSAEIPRIRILPGISQIVNGEAHLVQTRTIDAHDLLGRTPVFIALKESLEYLRGKRVLITGAGGSIGSELSRQLLSGGAQRLYLLDHDENSIYEIEKELKILQKEGVGEKATIVPVIGELQDKDYVNFILNRLKCDVIFHCAAHKHVPLLEANPIEAVKNNVFSTKNLVNAARKNNISKFVFISTDKAVEPTSVYGISKMLAEEIVLKETDNAGNFMVVRFGNVLGSRGSIVPLFTKQILTGGPVTITHPEMMRFFMTIPEASSLVLKTGGVGNNGDLYILDMKEPLLIKDLAEQMIQFHGYTPEKEIPIKYIGMRAGEKLIEKLWEDNEAPLKTEHPGVLKLERKYKYRDPLEKILLKLKKICYLDKNYPDFYRNRKELRKLLHSNIPTLMVPEDEPEF